MANLRVQRRRANASDAGASLVEFALVMPLLFLLLLGTLTGGLTLSRQNSVKNAVREGTRLGAVYPIDDGDATTTNDLYRYLREVYREVERASTGDLNSATSGHYICVAFIDGASKSFLDSPTASDKSSGECFADGITTPGARVQTVARRPSDIQALLFSMNVTLRSQATTRYERA